MLNIFHICNTQDEIDLKDMEISKLKEYHELQLKARSSEISQKGEMESVERRVQEGVKALQRAELELQRKATQL